jgi:hypothetical protein
VFTLFGVGVEGCKIKGDKKDWNRAVADERKLPGVSRIIPGDWAKARSGWLAWPL